MALLEPGGVGFGERVDLAGTDIEQVAHTSCGQEQRFIIILAEEPEAQIFQTYPQLHHYFQG